MAQAAQWTGFGRLIIPAKAGSQAEKQHLATPPISAIMVGYERITSCVKQRYNYTIYGQKVVC